MNCSLYFKNFLKKTTFFKIDALIQPNKECVNYAYFRKHLSLAVMKKIFPVHITSRIDTCDFCVFIFFLLVFIIFFASPSFPFRNKKMKSPFLCVHWDDLVRTKKAVISTEAF